MCTNGIWILAIWWRIRIIRWPLIRKTMKKQTLIYRQMLEKVRFPIDIRTTTSLFAIGLQNETNQFHIDSVRQLGIPVDLSDIARMPLLAGPIPGQSKKARTSLGKNAWYLRRARNDDEIAGGEVGAAIRSH